MKFELRSVDAVRSESDCWVWNNSCVVDYAIDIPDNELTARGILKALRDQGYLSPDSKGLCTVEGYDCASYEVQLRGTYEPILALHPIDLD